VQGTRCTASHKSKSFEFPCTLYLEPFTFLTDEDDHEGDYSHDKKISVH
jgi:hypothetical protein